jgi:beta-galactosidase
MRETLNFDRGWLFHAGDIPSPVPNTHLAAYMNHKAGWARGAARGNFDDSDWRPVNLPHDWSVEGPFSPDHHLSSGFLPRGVGWYRRHFSLDSADAAGRVEITFDGIATHCTVYVNGHLLHRHFCGYTPFTVDITDVARFGDDLNVIAVRVDATHMEGWWYEGAGMYRHVWLEKTPRLHIVGDEVAFVPAFAGGESWIVKIEAPVRNGTRNTIGEVECMAEFFDDTGSRVAETHAHFDVEPGERIDLSLDVIVDDPRLWSPDSPVLYTARTRLIVPDGNDMVVRDEVHTSFGFRTVVFDAHRGFFLNGQPLKLLGTCNHQDHSGLGVALPDSIHEFRVRKLKEMGCNAYRAAHHPPAKELLDACDRLGMLVMNENRSFGSSPEHLGQLAAMVRRDRNHPSVILWSLCNEESIQTTPVSRRIAETMAQEVRRLDPSRPVTAAVSGGVLNEGCIGDALDVMCINYQLPLHDGYHEKFPRKPLVAGETHCVVSTRGIYRTDEPAGLLACDDTVKHPWGETARATWRHVSVRPYVAGLFAWTGFDYRGEPMPGTWPVVLSQMGLLDLCGFEKDSFFLHKAWWTAEPFVHLLPHWNWSAGETVKVRAYTNCESVELSLNGRSLGRKGVDSIEMVSWDVPFEPGALTAEGYRSGVRVAGAAVSTAGPAAGLRLRAMMSLPDDVLPADGAFAAPIEVFAVDEAGNGVPSADVLVSFDLAGPGRIIGVGNGNPVSHEPDKAESRRLFNGRAMVIVQADRIGGAMVLTARADGLASGTLHLRSQTVALPPEVPLTVRRHLLTDWRVSPATQEYPDPRQQLAASDMNSWERVTIGPPTGQPGAAGWAIFRTTFTLRRALQSTGGRIVFHALEGEAEVFLGVAALPARRGDGLNLSVDLPPTAAKQTLTVLVNSCPTDRRLCGPVEVLPPP